VVIRSLPGAPVALRLSMCSKSANGPRPRRQPRQASSRRSMVGSIQAETAKSQLTQRRTGKDLRSALWLRKHGAASGYSRMSALRQRTGVKKEYDKRQAASRQVENPNAETLSYQQAHDRGQGEREKAREGDLKKLNIPSDLPSWSGCKQLVAMIEEPFTLNANSDVFYSPVCMWQSRQNQHKEFSKGWHASSSCDTLS